MITVLKTCDNIKSWCKMYGLVFEASLLLSHSLLAYIMISNNVVQFLHVLFVLHYWCENLCYSYYY